MKNYFKDIRNWFHMLIGLSIGYAITLVFGFPNRENYPLSWSDLRTLLTPIVGAVIIFGFSFYWEKQQDKIRKGASDMRDVYVSTIAGYMGGFICLLVPSLLVAIILTTMSFVVLINSFKK